MGCGIWYTGAGASDELRGEEMRRRWKKIRWSEVAAAVTWAVLAAFLLLLGFNQPIYTMDNTKALTVEAEKIIYERMSPDYMRGIPQLYGTGGTVYIMDSECYEKLSATILDAPGELQVRVYDNTHRLWRKLPFVAAMSKAGAELFSLEDSNHSARMTRGILLTMGFLLAGGLLLLLCLDASAWWETRKCRKKRLLRKEQRRQRREVACAAQNSDRSGGES